MYEVSDEQGNRFFVESKKLACQIVNEKENPFINIVDKCHDLFYLYKFLFSLAK